MLRHNRSDVECILSHMPHEEASVCYCDNDENSNDCYNTESYRNAYCQGMILIASVIFYFYLKRKKNNEVLSLQSKTSFCI